MRVGSVFGSKNRFFLNSFFEVPIFNRFWSILGGSGKVWGGFGKGLGRILEGFGAVLEPFGEGLGRILERFKQVLGKVFYNASLLFFHGSSLGFTLTDSQMMHNYPKLHLTQFLAQT